MLWPIAPKDFTLTFLKKEQVAKDAYAFHFDRSHAGFDFLPGQHVRMILPHENPDNRRTTRLFSIASSPHVENKITITTRIVSSTFKKKMLDLQAGQEVAFFGPLGRFVLDEKESRPILFIAGGIGVSPFYSMIQFAVAKKMTNPIYLFASFSTLEDFIYYEEFLKLSKAYPTIKVIYVITRHDEALHGVWENDEGRISPEVIQKYVPDVKKCLFYICGPHIMLFDMNEMVVEMGVNPENIKREDFVGY